MDELVIDSDLKSASLGHISEDSVSKLLVAENFVHLCVDLERTVAETSPATVLNEHHMRSLAIIFVAC